MNNNHFIILLRYAAVTGNILFVLWIAFNAIDDGFSGTLPEKASFIGLTGLLTTNTFLVLKGRKTILF